MTPSGPELPIALWAVPRSISSAFERMMRARGDIHVLYEPFQDYYYFSEERVTEHFSTKKAPDPSFHHSAILRKIIERPRPVFFKDMAYHLSTCMSPKLVGNFHNTFLIRHPRWVLPSLYKVHPDCTLEETGFDQQLRLMKMVEAEGKPLVVIDAEDLLDSPETVVRDYCSAVGLPFVAGALRWEADAMPEWEPFREWHEEAIRSTRFERRSETAPDLSGVPPDVYEHCVEVFAQIVALKPESRVAS